MRIAVTSGTTALHLAIAALDLEQGSEVLVSASTNIATGLAASHNNLVPVAVDSENATWNLDLDLVETLVTEKTKAIIPVHLFGHPVDMDRLCSLAAKHGLYVVEDCAEAHGARCRDRMVGSFGDMACFSFYANKIITTGEGGMIVTNDLGLAERLRLLRNLGFGKPRFYHEVAGFNFRMTGYQAAMGSAQLKRIDEIVESKRRVGHAYQRLLGDIPGIVLPREANWAKHVYWMYGIVVEPEFGISRDQLAAVLLQNGIETRTFFCSMNEQPCFRRLEGFRDVPTPVANKLWRQGLYLPSSISLPGHVIEGIAQAVKSARMQ